MLSACLRSVVRAPFERYPRSKRPADINRGGFHGAHQPLPHQRNRADEWRPPPGEHDSDRIVGRLQRAWTVRLKVRLVEVVLERTPSWDELRFGTDTVRHGAG
jgi:hypothetical protein